MQYRAFISSFLCGCIALIGLCALLFVLSANFQTRRNDRGWAPALLKTKTGYLRDAPSPKAVIVSGSNGLFGIDTKQLSKTASIPVYNAACYAALSWDYVDYYALKNLKAGDTVILPLEPNYYIGYDRLNSETVIAAHSVGLGYFFSLTMKEKVTYLRLLNAKFIWQQLRDRMVPGLEKKRSRYFDLTLLPNGDIDLSAAVPEPDKVRREALSVPQLPEGKISSTLCSSVKTLREKGVHVLFTQPNVYTEAANVPGYETFIREVAGQVEQCGAKFVSVPSQGILPLDMMLDTAFHPNQRGRSLRTEELGRALCRAGLPCGPGTPAAKIAE